MFSFLTGWQAYLIGGAMLAIASFGGGFYLAHRIDASTLSDLKAQDAKARADAIQAASLALQKQDKAAMDAAVAEAESQQKIVTKTVTLTKEIPVYVTPAQDKSVCGLTVGLARILRAAAASTDPASLALTTGQHDDDCSDLTPSEVASWFTQYAAASQANAEQLNALRASIVSIHDAAGKPTSVP